MKSVPWDSLLQGMVLLTWLAAAPRVYAEDLVTISGATYRQVRAVRVEPDGITWEHATGLCKVDFTDLSEAIRKAYHYDAKKAAAYQAAQAQARQRVVEQAQQDQQNVAAQQARRVQLQTATTNESDTPTNSFVYRRSTAEAAVEKAVGEQIDTKRAAYNLLNKDNGTLWDRRLWAVPCLILCRPYSPGVAFDPYTDLNASEYKASLVHPPATPWAADCMHDNFFKPYYMTRSYDRDVERAEAFARGHP